MKSKYFKIMAAVMAVILICSCLPVMASYSIEKVNKDYRNIQLINTKNATVSKPIAQFAAKRIVNGEVADAVISYDGYDCNADFPTLICYVGETLSFEDLSRDTNKDGKIIEWDWQYFGPMGGKAQVYNYNICNQTSFKLEEAGEAMFYLCVRNDQKVKRGCCDPWSENGNHQTIGKNKAFPNGAYWYFTAIRVVIRPAHEAKLHVRYVNSNTKEIISNEILYGESIIEDEQILISANVTPPEGYLITEWELQQPDGKTEQTGTEYTVTAILNKNVPEKYLIVECVPILIAKLTVNYLNSETREIISTDTIVAGEIYGETNITLDVVIENKKGYITEGWSIKDTDGNIKENGNLSIVEVTLNKEYPEMIVEVYCFKMEPEDEKDKEPPEIEIVVKPSGVCDGIIEWTEKDSHRVFDGYVDGERTYSKCRHTFKYKACLTAEADVSPDTFKSGYGFEIKLDADIDVELVSRDGGCSSWGKNRKHESKIKNPDLVVVYIPWNMENWIGVQSKSIKMDSYGKLKWQLPESSVSEIGARRIYTPVKLSGTEEEPESHKFEIYISGGGVGDIEFCQKLDASITINGDMYSDDFSGSN